MTIDTNELRMLAQAASGGPDGVSLNWIKPLQDFQQKVSPAVISELLDRLEAAESEALEQARLNGMGASREASLMAKLEAAEKSDAESIAMCRKARDERDALRTKIEAMERQEPVRWGCTVLQVDRSWKEEIGIEEPPKDYFSIRNAFPLYALPGAKGEEK